MAMYRVKAGRYARHEQDGLRVYKVGEEVDLDPDLAARLGAQVEPAHLPAPQQAPAHPDKTEAVTESKAHAEDSRPDPDPAESAIHDMTVAEALEWIGKADRPTVEALRDAEALNPKHEGGRLTVIRAIGQRLAALGA